MIQPTKLISLCIRIFTRPISIYIKGTYISSQSKPLIPRKLISFGHSFHRQEMDLRNKLLKKTANYKRIADEKALEIGIDYLCEGFIYSILFLWGIYEYKVYKNQTFIAETKYSDNISSIILKIERLDKSLDNIRSKYKFDDSQ